MATEDLQTTGTVEEALRALLVHDDAVDAYWDQSHILNLGGETWGWFQASGLDEKAWAKAANTSITQAKKALNDPERMTIKTLMALASQAGYAVEVTIIPRAEARRRLRKDFGIDE